MKNLANSLRPQTLNDIVGHEKIVNLLTKVVENKIHSSFLFYGKSGIGKTSCAVALANDMGLKYAIFNPTTDNKNDLLAKLENNEVIIIDEIHRLNKDRQDILLSFLEFDKIIVYATTTENPYFRVNPALRSRMQILQLEQLTHDEIVCGLEKVISKYFKDLNIKKDVLDKLVENSNGDYRFSLNNLQMLSFLSNTKNITMEDLSKFIPNINFYSDKDGDSHYNNLSAFHKSLRGSDVNAALYYGALILKTGDYQGLFRRLNAFCYEDVGFANTMLPLHVNAAMDAVERLGFPEASLPIYFIIIYSALSPKSNTVYKSLSNVEEFISAGNIYDVPNHLKDSHYKSASKLKHGIGYKYPHDFPNHWVKQEYLPNEIKDKVFVDYSVNDNKNIISYKDWVEEMKKRS